MKKSQTGSAHAIITIILVVAVLGLLGLVFWQNLIQKKDTTPTHTVTTTTTPKNAASDPYAGWQTYTNKDLGFSVKYPADWKLDTSKANTLVVGDLVSSSQTSSSLDSSTNGITIQTEPKSGSTSQSSSLAIATLRNGSTTDGSMKYTDTLNGIAVTEYDMNAQTPYFAAIFTIGDNYIELDFNTAPTKADLSATATKILESVHAL